MPTKPLLIHMTDSLQIGIGKSETAYQLASALFETFPGSRNPCGLLTIMGGDYSEQSLHFSKGGLLEVSQYIFSASVLQYLIICGQNVM